MANFATPFASSGPRRNPTSDERANGFPCGPADQTLFNGLFHRIEAELGNVIQAAGITPSDASFSQVYQAIAALIEAATGGGETENYLLLSQAASRLPIFPEVLSADGKINITSPANGTIRLPGGVNFLHRGISAQVTAETDFPTVSSRTYHLRWNPVDGFALKDLGDSGYNPDTLAESDVAFDSTFDDMLVARIVTNSSNVPTITPLANKDRLSDMGSYTYPGTFTTNPSDFSGSTGLFDLPSLNWARRPRTRGLNAVLGSQAASALHGHANLISQLSTDRYKTSLSISSDWYSASGSYFAIVHWSFSA